ncbi:MAG: ribosome biogenesis protein [Candidatus Heimdallarchaeota archaeon]|nr:ribosome biogenesis protein [Candidatus Heimdallarchaeota archaeon]
MRLLKKCECSYTIDPDRTVCEKCNERFMNASPPRFSLHDKYAGYRRRMKELAKEKGLL